MQYPMDVELANGFTLTITGVPYAYKSEMRRQSIGELSVAFEARDAEGRTGTVLWEYAWEGRDVERDALYTDRPEWATPLGDEANFEWPTAYFSPSDFSSIGEEEPECTIRARDDR